MFKLLVILIFSQNDSIINQTTGELWSHISNYGTIGGESAEALYGYSWPGSSSTTNNYLWGSYFAIGTYENGKAYVTRTIYPPTTGEWAPGPILHNGPGVSDQDVILIWHDLLSNPRNSSGRHLGITVLVKSYTWAQEPFNDFIIYELFVTWNSSQCDILNVGSTLDSVYVGFLMDFDISSIDPSNPHIDDLVFFDGYTAGEWSAYGYPFDSITILPDSFTINSDGYYDQYIIFGDNLNEKTLHGEIEIIPRNLSYMYDGDDPSVAGDDTGENGGSAGYTGLALLYAPPSKADSIWIDNYGDTARIVRVWSHQWWDWSGDPGDDSSFYDYMAGTSSITGYHRFAYLPDSVFDYRVLITSGPFTLKDNDTLKFVWVGAVGQGLNGGYDSYFGRGWIRGLRQTIDYAMLLYYSGSQNSDPYHPSAPDEDIHYVGIRESFKKSKKVEFIPTLLNVRYIISKKLSEKYSFYNSAGRRVNNSKIKKGIYFLNKKGKALKIIVIN